ncbi:MAG: 2-succinyl-5-enolpyruvyl-6-hydroxy-3-cyclohexene-1-carboxylic-acid synthase [Crocinitomicaceae bacterium]|tara:strand:- start:2909 stop:4585 length:1677 start_codon:yes stop_codon:yes gene_type:complete
MEISNKAIVQKIVEECLNNGVKHIVFSPGSRNAPFAISFDRNPFFQTHVIHDERAAAFYALGIAQTLNEPVVLCCTSGSAALNYFPALSESFYRQQPLLILSADRPKKLINKGQGQTIMQDDLFGKHSKRSWSIEEVDKTSFTETATEFFQELTTPPLGPMHLNVHLEEPLYGLSKHVFKALKPKELGQDAVYPSFELNNKELAKFSNKKILVLCGQGSNDIALKRELIDFSKNSNVVVLNENTSALNDPSFVNCIDRTLNSITPKTAKRFTPDIIITIGGAVVSKKIKTFFVENPPKQHIAIHPKEIGTDLFLRRDFYYNSIASDYFLSLNMNATLLNTLNFKASWQQLDCQIRDRLPEYFVSQKNETDLEVFNALYQVLPENCTLHLGNSSVVRYMQLFDPIKDVLYECNRGTSGIDGCTSTAVGCAIASPKRQHVFVSGDISFIYDSNALWIKPFPKNLKMIVIDNKGGGIFKIIDGPKTSNQLERYFEAKHDADVSSIAEGFGIKVYDHKKDKGYQEKIIHFFQDEQAQLLVLETDSEENPKDLNRFFKHLKNA